jgi:predicted small metal-binding protein
LRSTTERNVVPFSQTCPRCGRDFDGDDKEKVADQVVEHARAEHRHTLDREIVLAHLEGVHPYERED